MTDHFIFIMAIPTPGNGLYISTRPRSLEAKSRFENCRTAGETPAEIQLRAIDKL